MKTREKGCIKISDWHLQKEMNKEKKKGIKK